MRNPVPTEWVAENWASDKAVIAHDAWEEGRCVEALALLVGEPATIAIGSDRYEAVVVRATHKTLTAAYQSATFGGHPVLGKHLTFRLTKRGWRHGSHSLAVGFAWTHIDPEF